jgi:hypothetical protein
MPLYDLFDCRVNKYTGLFITTIADTVRSKYNFNHKRSDARLARETLQLPPRFPDSQIGITWSKYAKAIMRCQIMSYLEYLKRRN